MNFQIQSIDQDSSQLWDPLRLLLCCLHLGQFQDVQAHYHRYELKNQILSASINFSYCKILLYKITVLEDITHVYGHMENENIVLRLIYRWTCYNNPPSIIPYFTTLYSIFRIQAITFIFALFCFKLRIEIFEVGSLALMQGAERRLFAGTEKRNTTWSQQSRQVLIPRNCGKKAIMLTLEYRLALSV